MPKKKPSKTRALPKSLPYKGWTPLEHGVTQSILQKLDTCVDRSHKKLVLGMKEIDRKEAMEFGSIFHKLSEKGADRKLSETKLKEYIRKYVQKYFPSEPSVLLARICLVTYLEYRKWEATRPSHRYIATEPVFEEPFTLPPISFNPCPEISIRVPANTIIKLRGRIDGVIEMPDGMWIEEHKTKSRVDLSFLQDTIHCNIQVMMYAVCAELKYGRPCKGVIYNIIRKPQLRQRVKETDNAFLNRIQEDIRSQPEHYFTRLKVAFDKGVVDRWKREELIPMLYRAYIWWKSIEQNPTDPWAGGNPFHGRRSFGIYDPMSEGKGDFYDLIEYGRNTKIVIDHQPFPELQDDDID